MFASKEELFTLVARAADLGVFNIYRENLDLLKLAGLIASLESARYYTEHMLQARPFATRAELLKFALSQAPAEGLVLEFGVGAGASMRVLAQSTGRRIFGFDSFAGLPEDWRTGFAKGAFEQAGARSQFAPNVQLVEGLFAETLPRFLAQESDAVAFLHVDCDLYSSARTVLEGLASRLREGTVIVFDEYLNFPGWQHHEYKAFQELVAERRLAYRYLGFVRSGSQVATRIGASDETAERPLRSAGEDDTAALLSLAGTARRA